MTVALKDVHAEVKEDCRLTRMVAGKFSKALTAERNGDDANAAIFLDEAIKYEAKENGSSK